MYRDPRDLHVSDTRFPEPTPFRSDPEALGYLSDLERRAGVRVLRYDAPFNYSAINNWAVAQCESAVVGLVNNDIEVITGDWLEEMVSQALRPGIGAVGGSEEHTSELQSLMRISYAVFCLKKKKRTYSEHDKNITQELIR